ncbi:MAG: T9SS type A sorting domain-containing protein [Saprospiraceae bacterium]|nr:T9SS type A sorting domain-containing protein [Saprospiraceae bacterium]
MKHLLFFVLVVHFYSSYSQILNTITYRDTSLPRIEINPSHYNFIYPIEKDFYDSISFTPPMDGRFLVQNYGPRTILNYDNHQGSDIWGHTIKDGVLTYNPPALCMCNGEIVSISDGPDSIIDLTNSGRTIAYRCDSASQIFNSPINIYYRHLDSIVSLLFVGMNINKGDTLAFVGESGTTSLSHLHFDYKGIPNQWGNTTTLKYLNPNRLFDPYEHPHVLGKLNNAHIEILHDWTDSTLIRIHWPHNQHINRFEFTNNNYNLVYDVEEVRASYTVFEPSIWARDSMKIFPYRTNGYRSALYYQLNDTLPAFFPNSPYRDTNLLIWGYSHIPLTADSVVNVYDFILLDVPSTHATNDWIVKLTDVWGYTVEGQLSVTNSEDRFNPNPSFYFYIYPNPTADLLTIKYSGTLASNIVEIHNINGKLILVEKISKNGEQIDISKLNQGLYLISFNGVSARFLKE